MRQLIKKWIKDSILRTLIVSRVETKKKMVALTFDDGPNPDFTLKVLEQLKEYDAVATFFLVGNQVKSNPDLINKLSNAGNEIGNHSMTHNELKGMSFRETCHEFDAMDALIKKQYPAVNYNGLIRPPKGVINLPVLRYCLSRKKKAILWDRDPKDYKADSSQLITDYFKQNIIKAGNIILLHDKTQPTVEVLPYLLEDITRRGLTPVTISHLLASS